MKQNRGSALIIAIVTVLILSGVVGALMVLITNRQYNSAKTVAGRKAKEIAETGANNYLSGINQGTSVAPGPITGDTVSLTLILWQGEITEETVKITATRQGTDVAIYAVGEFDGVQHTVTLVATPTPPAGLFPGGVSPGALSILGEPGPNFQLQVTGSAKLTGGSSAALMIQDKDTFDGANIEQIVDDIFAGNYAPDTFTGSEQTFFKTSSGQGMVPFKNKEGDSPTTDFLTTFQEAFVDYAEDNVAIADNTLSNTTYGVGPVVFGTPAAPEITVIEDNVTFDGALVSGAGTLIIKGNASILGGANFTWDGDIIILGETDASTNVTVKSSSLSVTGKIFSINKEGNGVNLSVTDSNMTLDGSYMSLSTGTSPSQTTFTDGLVDIKGIYIDMADSGTQFAASNSGFGPTKFKIKGTTFLAATDTDGDITATLDGKTELIFDQKLFNKERKALNAFVKDKLTFNPPPGGYSVKAYFEKAMP